MPPPADTLVQRIRDCPALPSLPAVALEVLDLTRNGAAGPADLAAAISKDPALSVKILRAVNSSFYGLTQRVSALGQAVALLGLQSVKTLVLGFSLVDGVKGRRPNGLNYMAYWRRTIYAATAARLVAKDVLPGRADECFVGALLMDLGVLVLDRVLGEEYGDLHGRARTHSDLLELEAAALGLTHAAAGAVLAEHWKLPPLLRSAMTHHHAPAAVEDPTARQVTQVVQLAGRCADVFVDDEPAAAIAAARRTFLDCYQWREGKADEVLSDVARRTAELGPLFEVKIPGGVRYETILERASQTLLELSLAEQAPPAPKKEAAVNRRRSDRIRRDGSVSVIPCAAGVLGDAVQVRLKDLSPAGIGLSHVRRMEKGSQFIVQLPDPGGGVKNLLYTVVRCTTHGHVSDIGAELVCVLTPQRAGALAQR